MSKVILESSLPILQLPVVKSRQAKGGFRSERELIRFPAPLMERIERLEAASLVMATAFIAMLHRYAGQDEILVASPAETGLLAVRADLSGGPSFTEMLKRVKAAVADAEALPEQPVQAMFAFGSHSLEEAFEVALFVVCEADGWSGHLHYNAELFENDTIQRMTKHYLTLLEGATSAPEELVSQLPFLTEAERQQLIVDWNAQSSGWSFEKPIHRLFEEQAERTPDAAAVVFEQESLTYRELNRRANCLAHHLRKRGVGPEVPVTLFIERSLDLVVGVLGVLKAGGAYIPLDPAYPEERIALILDDSEAKILLTQEHLLSLLPPVEGEVVCLDAEADRIAEEPQTNPAHDVLPHHLAYMIYTSGSTGKPKAVMVEHGSLAGVLTASRTHFGFGEQDVMPWIASVAFDIALFELMNPLLNGGTAVVLSREQVLNLSHLVSEMEGYTAIHTVPSLMRQIVQTIREEGRNSDRYDGIRLIFIGGDAVPPDLLAAMYEVFRNAQIHVLYGPTEGTIICAHYPVPRDQNLERLMVGTRLCNAKLRLYDGEQQLVPIGLPGELYIGGASVSRGYYRREALTEEKYVMLDGERWYRTGDLLRYLQDGTLEFLGRIDHQVKIRGFRVEIGEIENVLSQHPAVHENLVVVREESSGDKRLVAYVVPQEGERTTPKELRLYLKERLPEYMVPSYFVLLQEMPLNANGKVDRRALPAPEQSRPELDTEYAAPRTQLEQQLAAIWAEVLQMELIGVHDHFIELGGHSLLATRILSRVRHVFQVTLLQKDLFAAPTIALLAEKIQATEQDGEFEGIETISRGQFLPLSYAQQRLWFLDQLEPGTALYNIPIAWRIEGFLQRSALQQALNEMTERHESLRTTFVEFGGQPYQQIASSLSVDLPVWEMNSGSMEEREQLAMQRVHEAAQHPFDLSRGPLMRAQLIQLSEQEHLLFFNFHHIVFDGWSDTVFRAELTSLYEAFASGRQSPLTEMQIQYADFAHWQRNWLPDEAEKQLSYWKQQLSGTLPVLQLPTDRPKPAVQSFRGAVLQSMLPSQLIDGLAMLSQREGATMFMTLLAAFQTLLYRYSGQDDLIVGTPIANRNRGEIEGLIGFFVNTLALRTELSGDLSFRQLLSQVRETALGAYAHQDVPFEKLVEELQPDRDMSQSPLFQVMFSMESTLGLDMEWSGLRVRPVDVHNGTSMFDLTLTIRESSDGLAAALEYNVDLFDDATIARMLGHFQTLLEAVAANPDQQLASLPLLTAGERHQLLVEWNETTADIPRDKCVHELFAEQAERTPDAVALVMEEQRMTYRELNERANQLSRYLQTVGVEPGVKVGMCLERSLDMIVGLLGIWKAGGGYVPLDLAYPQERLAFMVEDTQVPVLLTQEHLVDSLPPHQAKVVRIDADWHRISQESAEKPTSAYDPEQNAYVIYTSGSTGKPKGVLISHASLVNHNIGIIKQFDLKAEDQVLLFTSISFDNAAEEIYPTLLCGATLVLAHARVPSYAELLELIERERLSVLNLPTAYWSEWLYEMAATGQKVPECVRLMVVGGEKVTIERYKAWSTVAGEQAVFMHAYGLTETTITSTFYTAPAGGQAVPAELPIGRPIINTYIYILDAAMNPVPIGVPGELYIGGECLARGYLHREDLTAEKFMPNPFRDEPGAILYKTGDLVRYLPDGNIDFMGRIDHQVKIRGYRVELGEIEETLMRHPQVRHVVVVVREDEPRMKRVVAYVLPEAGQELAASELRAFLKAALPEYMVPSAFVMLETLPLTPTGKVDRKALPAPAFASEERDEEFVLPRTPVEEVTAGIFAQILGIEQVSIHDNFFELGGHSLLATQVVSRVRDIFRVSLSLRVLFESPTVAGLAAHVEEASKEEYKLQALPQIQPVSRDGSLPLSFAQQRLWFLDQLDPNSAAYNMVDVIRLEGALHVTALEQSINEIVRRHEALRTVFAERDGQPVQIIQPYAAQQMPVIDMQGVPEAQQEERAMHIAKEEAQRPFDLTRDLLLKTRLLKLNEQTHMLVLTTHHIVNDGWSVGVFFKELAALYEAFSAGLPSPLTELPVQYADFAAWQRDWMQGEVLEEQLKYWKQHLGGELPVLQMPTDRPRPAKPSFKGAVYELTMPLELYDGLRAFSRREGASLFMTLLAAFDALLYRYSGQEDLLVGSAIANRNREDIEGLIGFFVNTLALRTDLSGNPTFRELVGRVREVALGAYAHQDLPFEKLVEEIQPERDLTQSPLFRVLFVLQNAPMDVLELSDLSLTLLGVDNETAKFDLMLSLTENVDGLYVRMEYDVDLYDRSTMARMVEQFQQLLESVVADPAQRIAQIPLLTEGEQRRLIVEWNDTATDYPKNASIHKLFEQQVEQTPDAVALVFGEERLTYGELNRRANQLARALRKRGVAEEMLVGLCMERSLDMVVGLLAILKTGAAYVPLDPAYPKERLAFMLEDTQVPVLLTHQSLVERLPEHQAKVINVDTDRAAILAESVENPQVVVSADHLAYVIYTSGSTGRPKGVCVPHRGVVRLVRETNYAEMSSEEVFLQLAPVSFDAATFEIWGSLLNGAKLVIFPAHKPSVEELGQVVAANGITTLWLTAGLFHLVAESSLEDFRSLRQLLAGGDVLSVPHVQKVLNSLPECCVINGYGPTENTTFTCCYPMSRPEQTGTSVPIGRPISNTSVYVLDSQMQPVPVGVPGELYIGGDGLARGYWNQPELTAERFVPNPFAEEEGACLYKTGDLVRWLPDGNIEFLGRIDTQVKIRGHRIEPGEIETVLSQHSNVRETVVIAREDEPGDKRLVAYVVPNYEGLEAAAEQGEEEWQSEQVSEWEMLFDETYNARATDSEDDTFNIVGWNSSYTGQPIPATEMREWLDATIDRIRGLDTNRVLEIGCGTGMILHQIAPHSSKYWGMDLSSSVLQSLREQLSRNPEIEEKVQLLHRKADDLNGIESGSFDLVILNSVIQYFPSIEYLVQVVEGAVQAVGERGAVFLGDVRSFPLLQAFHTAVELHRAPDSLTVEQLLQAAQSRMAQDNELVIDPAFFYALQQRVPQIRHVEVMPKHGHAHNELTQFRYDVILHLDDEADDEADDEETAAVPEFTELDWRKDGLGLSSVREMLVENNPDLLMIRAVPNARIFHAVHTLELLDGEDVPATVRDIHAALAKLPTDIAMEPEVFWTIESELPYYVEIFRTHADQSGTFDVMLRHREGQAASMRAAAFAAAQSAGKGTNWSRYANQPMHTKYARTLVPEYRTYLEEKLPDYMVPSAFVVLDSLPLTPNGKVDRKALPAPDKTRPAFGIDYVAPNGPVEEMVADVWKEILGFERIGAHDNFFEMGGHSLMATQVVSRLRDAFEIELPLQKIFEAPTVAQLAAAIEGIIFAEIDEMSEEEAADLLEDHEQQDV